MWDDRVDMMSLVQECLMSKHPSKMGLITDTLIAKGYHRCDKDERKKELAVMRLRTGALHDVEKQFITWGNQFEEGSPQRKHFYGIALQLTAIAGEYAGLRARIEAAYGASE